LVRVNLFKENVFIGSISCLANKVPLKEVLLYIISLKSPSNQYPEVVFLLTSRVISRIEVSSF